MAAPPTPPEDRPSKQAAFRAFLQEGYVSLHLDARRAGVAVPQEFAGSPHLVLQYGLHMPIPIPDLEVNEEGVVATLSFARQPQRTVVPWNAVYIVACEDGRGVLYYEDVPEEVSLFTRPVGETGNADAADASATAAVGEAPAAERPLAAGEPEPAPQPQRRRLTSVPLAADESAPPEPGDTSDANESPSGDAGRDDDGGKGKRRRRPTLKLVK